MSILTTGRSEPCKDGASGIKELWLTPFVQYDPASIVGHRGNLITSFPPTIMYEFQGNEGDFTEDYKDGVWRQRIVLSMAKLTVEDSNLLYDVMNLRVRAVVVDELGSIQVVGLHNGLDAEAQTTSGGALESFSGYRLTLTGEEHYPSPYLSAFPGGGTLPNSGFAKAPTYTTTCFLASSSLPSSTSQRTASCNILVAS